MTLRDPTGKNPACLIGGLVGTMVFNGSVIYRSLWGRKALYYSGWTGLGHILTGNAAAFALGCGVGSGVGALAEGGGGGGVLINIGGEGEVPGAINVQIPSIFEEGWASSASGQSLSELQAAGNQFVVADNTALPFAGSSVDTVITNNVPIDITTWQGSGVQSSEIIRILAEGGTWINNGAVVPLP